MNKSKRKYRKRKYIPLKYGAPKLAKEWHPTKKGKFPYYGASGIVDYVDDYIFDDELLLISEDGANLLARKYPICFSAKGKFWVNNHAHIVRIDDKILHKYLEYYLNALDIKNYITGSAQPKLNRQSMDKIKIKIPEKKVLKLSQRKHQASYLPLLSLFFSSNQILVKQFSLIVRIKKKIQYLK